LAVAVHVPSASPGEFESLTEFLKNDDLDNVLVSRGVSQALIDFIGNAFRPQFHFVGRVGFVEKSF
jgi:hypothetical protein